MDLERQVGVNFKVTQLNNSLWLISVADEKNNSFLDYPPFKKATYDDQGALYYVIAVLFMYAFSIILMIGSLIKKSKQDNGMSKYMEDLDKVRKVERRQLKYKSRLAMQNNKKVARAIERRMSTPCVLEMHEAFNADLESVENNSNNGDNDVNSSQESGLSLLKAINKNLFPTRCQKTKDSNSSQTSFLSMQDDDKSEQNRPRAAGDDSSLTTITKLKEIEEEEEVFVV